MSTTFRAVSTLKPATGRGIAMEVVGHSSSDVKCNYCERVVHVTQDCVALKESVGSSTSTKHHFPRHAKAGPGNPRRGEHIRQWCPLHKSTTHSDEDCRTQHGVSSAKADNANYAASQYIDYPISLFAVDAPTEEEACYPFGLTKEPVDTGRVFGSCGGVSGEETGNSLLMVEEEPAQQPIFRGYIVGVLTAMTRALVVVVILSQICRITATMAVLSRTTSNRRKIAAYGYLRKNRGRLRDIPARVEVYTLEYANPIYLLGR